MRATRGLLLPVLALLVGLVLSVPTAAAESFGLKELEVAFEEEDGSTATEAGGHPFQLATGFGLNAEETEEGKVPAEAIKDLRVEMPTGMVGDPTATARCSSAEFIDINQHKKLPACANDTAVGVAILKISAAPSETTKVLEPEYLGVPVFNLAALPGEAARLGMIVEGVPVTVDLRVSESAPYEVVATLENVSQVLNIYGSTVFVWGHPASLAHDTIRGDCVNAVTVTKEPEVLSTGSCPYEGEGEVPFLTSPRTCAGSLAAIFRADSWQEPGAWVEGDTEASSGFEGCDELGFEPTIGSTPTTSAAESSSGLDFELDVDDPGLTEPEGIADSDIEKAVVTLPEGVTTNPSVASGLAACTLAEYEEEKLEGDGGCPEASKIGTVEVETPLLEEEVEGELVPEILPGRIYVGKQHDNVFDNLLTIYMVIEDPGLGIFIKLPGRVEPDPTTGRLTTTFGEPGHELPQLPFSHFSLHFRGGDRAPLVTPATCGTYKTEALLYPWADPSTPVRRESTFKVDGGAGWSSCADSASQLPARQSLSAGTVDPKAGSYSPFVLKVARDDGTQQLRSISATLPEGLLGKLAGISYCSDAQIAQAQDRTGEGDGAIETADPSCPESSEVGTVVASAGAGSEPLYVTGHAYLAGPYDGAPLSLEIVTPAIAGPFDLGVVAVRTALQVDPLTAQITATSDSIPTILHGLPLDLRSITVEMNRSEFTLNPTSCEPKSIAGSVTSTLGTVSSLSQYFQASDCSALAFKPTLKLSLKGATKRTGHPALKAVVTFPKQGAYANIARAQVGLPHSEFLDQGNIGKTCTRPVLLEGNCPKKSIYGKAKAWTPLLEKPLEGPVYLVGGFGYKLPALVAELNGQIRVLLVGKIDTDKQNGIRNTFEAVPDAPVSRFVLEMKGGKKYGLLENSENICKKTQKAGVAFRAQNGRVKGITVKIANSCKKKKSAKTKSGRSSIQ
ncbi:MAG: hypothetical protein QM729_10830 [Solirubrobacterales bacterium]